MAYRRVSKARRKAISHQKPAIPVKTSKAVVTAVKHRRSNNRRKSRLALHRSTQAVKHQGGLQAANSDVQESGVTPSSKPNTELGHQEDEVAAKSITPRKLRSTGPVEIANSTP